MDGGVLPTMFYEESNNTIGANGPARNCKVTRGSNKHTAKNETSTPCSINEYEVKTNLGNVNLCCALPTVSMSN
ncbi:hypothetical protein [Wolbachia endosymbiont of Cantharis cryptica]|uniref:hypothetical protein n=1 Tax=Wolbachia endosymbiont of Cantharis cryptica TaxID=3066132 RepID=UPI00376F37DE